MRHRDFSLLMSLGVLFKEKCRCIQSSYSGDWCLRRIVQIGAGKVFGDAHFVTATAYALGDRFKAGSAGAHRVPVFRRGYDGL